MWLVIHYPDHRPLEFLQGVGARYKKGVGGRTIAHGAGEPFNVQTKGVDKKLHSHQKTKKKR